MRFGNKYAEDYHLDNITDRRGRLRTVSVYHGPYFRFLADAGTVERAKRLFPALSLLCLCAALAPLLMDARMTHSWYVLLPLALGLLPVAYLLMGAWRLLRAGELVTREHKDKLYDRFTGWSTVLLMLSALSLLGQAVYYLREPFEAANLPVTLCTLVLIASGAVLFTRRKALMMEQTPREFSTKAFHSNCEGE